MDIIFISIVFILIFMDSDGFRWALILYISIDLSSDVFIGKDIIIGLFHVCLLILQCSLFLSSLVSLSYSLLMLASLWVFRCEFIPLISMRLFMGI